MWSNEIDRLLTEVWRHFTSPAAQVRKWELLCVCVYKRDLTQIYRRQHSHPDRHSHAYFLILKLRRAAGRMEKLNWKSKKINWKVKLRIDYGISSGSNLAHNYQALWTHTQVHILKVLFITKSQCYHHSNKGESHHYPHIQRATAEDTTPATVQSAYPEFLLSFHKNRLFYRSMDLSASCGSIGGTLTRFKSFSPLEWATHKNRVNFPIPLPYDGRDTYIHWMLSSFSASVL